MLVNHHQVVLRTDYSSRRLQKFRAAVAGAVKNPDGGQTHAKVDVREVSQRQIAVLVAEREAELSVVVFSDTRRTYLNADVILGAVHRAIGGGFNRAAAEQAIHIDAVAQIGHAVVFDLDLGQAVRRLYI